MQSNECGHAIGHWRLTFDHNRRFPETHVVSLHFFHQTMHPCVSFYQIKYQFLLSNNKLSRNMQLWVLDMTKIKLISGNTCFGSERILKQLNDGNFGFVFSNSTMCFIDTHIIASFCLHRNKYWECFRWKCNQNRFVYENKYYTVNCAHQTFYVSIIIIEWAPTISNHLS